MSRGVTQQYILWHERFSNVKLTAAVKLMGVGCVDVTPRFVFPIESGEASV